MRHSHKHKFILISNWKCGSSSLSKMFDGYCEPRPALRSGSNHLPAREIKKIFAEKGRNFDEYIKIISVRNPWARVVSLYSYHKAKRNPMMPFSKYVKEKVPLWQAGVLRSPRWNTREMIHDYDGASLVDYAVRLENLKEDLSPIVEKHFPDFYINYNIRANTTEHDHYSTYYNEHTKSIIADLYHYDIEKWGYKFKEE